MIDYFPLNFIFSKSVIKRYGLQELLIQSVEKPITEPRIYRSIADIINRKRHVERYPYQAIRPGYLQAIGLINEVFSCIIESYFFENNLKGLENSFNIAVKKLGKNKIDEALIRFVELFPPVSSFSSDFDAKKYLGESTGGISNRYILLEKMKLLFLKNENAAFFHYIEFFDESELDKKTSAYREFIKITEDFLKKQPGFGPRNNSLPGLLHEPMRESPNSIKGQLAYIKDHWGSILSSDLLLKILLVLDIIKEEDKHWGPGPGPVPVPEFGKWRDGAWKAYGDYIEEERFSEDLDWMPRVVMLAKSTYVWLDQLSKKYRRSITRLDQIPDEELDTLAKWGFTGLWLIGLWERSPASQKIKQMCGNPEAMSSAYSLYDYAIAEDLGGEKAYQNLKYRASIRRIRLASDMVPNHMGIYSSWLVDHPDWFLSLDYSPYPGYSFNGPNLSNDERVGIYIEDGYWDKRDAAIVFKRVDHRTGAERFIYHGNDGTSMPWNDTAQLDFLISEVREAVMQKILHVARKFSIIRFDAAMTLAKKHYQRLWFPQPGTGGSIPSRAEHGMTREEFNKAFPKEFWREVVDRVAKEVPDTLLLAEAFWLMEGYFVRSLGMHRVYNSAFMNMLKAEENEKYRSVIKNVMEFDPRILQRFVNFMNNPDELTAIEQFGKGDKYFGISLMMVTLPGLPMFGHGQIEGYTEKYGMEYKRAYWDENVDWDLVKRHEAEIFPLMRKRHLFSGAENFVLFDFFTVDGYVDENVFVFSNRCRGERALVIYHNKCASTRGWIKVSAAFLDINAQSGNKKLVQKLLAEALEIKSEGKYYYIFKDQKTGLEYLRHGRELAEKGLYVELDAYQFHAFIDFREVIEDEYGNYYRLLGLLGGRGVPSIDEAFTEMVLSPVMSSMRQIINPDFAARFSLLCQRQDVLDVDQLNILSEFQPFMQDFLKKIKEFSSGEEAREFIAKEAVAGMRALLKVKNRKYFPAASNSSGYIFLKTRFPRNDYHAVCFWLVPLSWIILHKLGLFHPQKNNDEESASMMEEFLLKKVIYQTFYQIISNRTNAFFNAELVKILVRYQDCFEEEGQKQEQSKLSVVFHDIEVKGFLGVHWHDGVLWFNKENFEELLYWLFFTRVISKLSCGSLSKEAAAKFIRNGSHTVNKLYKAAEETGYRFEEFLEIAGM